MAVTTINQAANDTFPAKSSGVERTVGLGDTPADFGNATAVDITVDGSLTGFGNDTSCELDVWIETSGAVLLASDASTWKQVQSRSSDGSFTTAVLGFSTINTTASKADWDGAVLRYRQSITGINMGADSVSYTTTTTTAVDITYDVAVGEDTLLAEDVSSASSVTVPLIAQTQVLLADDVSSSSSVTQPVLSESSSLLADDVSSASSVTVPVLAGEHTLLADDVQSSSSVTTPLIAQVHSILGDDVSSVSSVTLPTLADIPVGATPLLAEDVQSSSSVTTPILAQVHQLNANDVQSSSTLTTPVVGEPTGENNLLADNVISISKVTVPVLAQVGDEFEDFTMGSGTMMMGIGDHQLMVGSVNSRNNIEIISTNGRLYALDKAG